MTETPSSIERLDAAMAAAASRGRRGSANAAFQARVEERLRGLEDDLSDVKGRLNGLYFVIASTILAQVVVKVAA